MDLLNILRRRKAQLIFTIEGTSFLKKINIYENIIKIKRLEGYKPIDNNKWIIKEKNEIYISDINIFLSISKTPVELLWQENSQKYLLGNNSKTKTLVNGKKISGVGQILSDKDQVKIGGLSFQILYS